MVNALLLQGVLSVHEALSGQRITAAGRFPPPLASRDLKRHESLCCEDRSPRKGFGSTRHGSAAKMSRRMRCEDDDERSGKTEPQSRTRKTKMGGDREEREQVRRREGSRVRAEQGERSGAGPGRVSRDGTRSILYVVVKFAPIQLSWWSNL